MNIADTLEMVLTQNSTSLGKISLTSKEWNNVTNQFRAETKLAYIKECSRAFRDDLLQELDYEMYRCCNAYYDDDFYYYWRDYIVDWEANWDEYRMYSFFYDDYIRKNHADLL